MTGILLINLGTPDQPNTKAVRRYLRQFLSDPYVIDIPWLARWILVHGIILPFRSPRSAEAYRKIWTPQGSPLLVHMQQLSRAVSAQLGSNYVVEVGMRYGNPSIPSALGRLREKGVGQVKAFPLYPQYAASSTESSIQELLRLPDSQGIEILPPFYNHPGFIQGWVATGKTVLAKGRPDYVLFSFHGLPERQVRRVEGCLVEEDCCQKSIPDTCYRSQSFETARLIAQGLGLGDNQFGVSFQSRLGRTPWIAPYTDLTLQKLAKEGKRSLVVFCPSFVADCLETLEEIGIRGKETFLSHGGKSFELVPSLNTHPIWVETLIKMIKGDL